VQGWLFWRDSRTSLRPIVDMPKNLSLIGAKGGTLKTTSVASLGHLLAVQGLKVLLIDGDPQGDLTARSGFQRVADPIAAPPVRVGYRGESHLEVWLLRGGRKLEEMDLKAMLRHIDRAQQEVEPDIVILDTPPALGPVTTAALIRSDLVIVGVEPGRESVERLHDIQILAEMHERPHFKALITRARENTNLFRLVAEQLDEMFPGRRLSVSIPLETAAAESAYFDVPPTVSVPDGNCARAYTRLADQVIRDLALSVRPTEVVG
jgi:chromosome partitioning protein